MRHYETAMPRVRFFSGLAAIASAAFVAGFPLPAGAVTRYYWRGASGGNVRTSSNWLDEDGNALTTFNAEGPESDGILVFTNFTGAVTTTASTTRGYMFYGYVFNENCIDVILSGTSEKPIDQAGDRATTWLGGPVRSEASSGTVKFGQAVNLFAGTNVVDVVNAGATIAVQNGLNGGDDAVLVKEGRGTFRVPVSYGSAVNNVKEIVMRGGVLLLTAADAKMNLTDCTVTFDGDDAVVRRSNSGGGQTYTKLEISGGCIRETDNVHGTGHGFSDRGFGYTLSLIGAIRSSRFTGSILDSMSFLWGPSDASQTFTFAKASHPTTGNFTVQSGTVALADGVSFPSIGTVTVKSGAALRAESGVGEAMSGTALVVESGATLHLADGASLRFKTATVGGAALAQGVYDASSGWIAGGGTVVVSGSAWPSDAGDVWNRDDFPATLAAGETAWYRGAELSGAAMALAAGDGAKAVIGASGVTSAGDHAGYTWSWPTWLYGAQQWTIASGDTLDIAAPLSTLSPGQLDIYGAGAIAFHTDIPLTSRIVLGGPAVTLGDAAFSGPVSIYGSKTISGTPGVTSTFIGKVSALNTTVGTALKFQNGTFRFRGGVDSSAVTFDNADVVVEDVPWTMGTHQGATQVNAGPRFQSFGDLTLSAPSNVISILNHAFPRTSGNLVIRTTVPYALYRGTADSSGATRGLQRVSLGYCGNNVHAPNCVWDLCGGDQELSGFPCSVSGATVTSESPAQLHYLLDAYTQNAAQGYVWYAVTNYACFAGAAGLSYEGTRMDAALVNVSTTTGRLDVASGRLSLLAPGGINPLRNEAWPGGSWPNATVAAVSGTGTLALFHSRALNIHGEVRIDGDDATLEIAAGVAQRCDNLYIDGVKMPTGRTYGAPGSGAATIDAVHFAGGGVLNVTGEHPAFVVVVR